MIFTIDWKEIKFLFQSKKKEENEDCRLTLRPQGRHPQTLFIFLLLHPEYRLATGRLVHQSLVPLFADKSALLCLSEPKP